MNSCILDVKKIAMIGIFLLFACGNSFSADGVIRSSSGAILLSTDGNKWRTVQGILLATVDDNGHVRDGGGRLVLAIDKDKVRDSQGRLLGSIDKDGYVRLANSQLVGRVSVDGSVRNASSLLIGKGNGVPRQWLGLYFFFLNSRR